MIFKKPKNLLEGHLLLQKTAAGGATELSVACPRCKKVLGSGELSENLHVCPYCRHHFRINARQRLSLICDEGSMAETDKDVTSINILSFPEYDRKLKSAALESAEKEGVVCCTCKIGGCKAAVFVMEPYFMMGSMGSAVGEKLTRLFERATKEHLPVVGFTVSGGARMQ
ncbi:MAG TPA: carboxyl transferase domain-containing protein, partial [Terriglobales bacterium]|nr:carboxyl transferase domain-containing protein [Terriglobales bacterium]